MKKLLVTLVAVALLLVGIVSVAAEDVVSEETQNLQDSYMSTVDAETYRQIRTEQINEALANGQISEDQAALLIEHIEDLIEDGLYVRGPQGYMKGDVNETCVLGENGNLGIFRNENSGLRQGQGFGGGRGRSTMGGQGNRGAGRGLGNNGVCLYPTDAE